MRNTIVLLCTALLVGCDQLSEAVFNPKTGLEGFVSCVGQRAIGDYDDAVHELCLQKYEIAGRSLSSEVTARIVSQSILEVYYYNNGDNIITLVEVEFSYPREESEADCKADKGECFTRFASGRTWIMPKKQATVQIRLPDVTFSGKFEVTNNRWSFGVESTRYMSVH